MEKPPFQKMMLGTLALSMIGFNFTKRFMNFPHFHKHKEEDGALLFHTGELNPFEDQPKGAHDKYPVYKSHL